MCVAVRALHLPLSTGNFKHDVFHYPQYAGKFTHGKSGYTRLCVAVRALHLPLSTCYLKCVKLHTRKGSYTHLCSAVQD